MMINYLLVSLVFSVFHEANSFYAAFDEITYKKFMNLVETEGEAPGIIVVPSFDYYNDDSIPEIYDPWFKSVVPDVSDSFGQ